MSDLALAERFSRDRESDATGDKPPSEHASSAKVDAVTSVRWFLFMTHSWQDVEVPADGASLPAMFPAIDTYCYVERSAARCVCYRTVFVAAGGFLRKQGGEQ